MCIKNIESHSIYHIEVKYKTCISSHITHTFDTYKNKEIERYIE